MRSLVSSLCAGAFVFAVLSFPGSYASFAQPAASSPAVLKKVGEVGKGEFKNLNYVCVDQQGNIYGGGGQKVVMFGPDGTKKMEWTGIDHYVSTVAVDETGKVYAAGLATKTDGKVSILGVKDGKPVVESSIALPPDMANVTSLKVSKGSFYVGSSRMASICIYSMKDGAFKKTAAIGQGAGGKPDGAISTCCGILDFNLDPKGNILIANLGQKKVVTYNKYGRITDTWGKDGKGLADFCGCCNPVSATVSTDGSVVVTAEKTTPRLKVYSRDGKKLLAITQSSDFSANCADLIVSIASDKKIYAVDGESNVIKVFACDDSALPAVAAKK